MADETKNPIKELADMDKLVYEPRRFAILNALEVAGNLDYTYLRRISGLSQGNLATHLAKLENAGLVEIRKRTILRRPNSRVYITDEGRTALSEHRRRVDQLKEEIKNWAPTDDEYRMFWSDD